MSIKIGHLGPAAALGALVIALFAAAQLSAQKRGGGHTESYGNNLSFPVIWAEGVEKTLRGTPGMEPLLDGLWYFWWGTGSNGDPLVCQPDEAGLACAEGEEYELPTDPSVVVYKVYKQQDSGNVWQAEHRPPQDGNMVNVDWIDWGDNLESVDWYLNSMVRTEVVLIKDLLETEPMTQYVMEHLWGLGIDEMWGLSTQGGTAESIEGSQATVYSDCARFVIQKLNVDRDNPALADLVWVQTEDGPQWTEPEGYEVDLINPSFFNKAVYEAGDGPGYYSAEINVKGKVIYGYTWKVTNLNEGAGAYRLTFALDDFCGTQGGPPLNTSFDLAEILLPLETEAAVEAEAEEETEGGGVAVIDALNNLTYMDINILPQKGGGKGGKKIWR